MQYVVIGNFKANNVIGVPGHILAEDEIAQIGAKSLDHLVQEKVIKVIPGETPPAVDQPEAPQDGPDPFEDEVAAPQPTSKKKKK